MKLEDISIHAFIQAHSIKNEKGDVLDFRNHMFLFDIYRDQSQYICVMKAAQVGMSTLDVVKTLYDAYYHKMDIIYTLPTDKDVQVFVGGKVNRIIDQNPIFQKWTADKDTIEQKQIGKSMIYFRGTFTERAAIMVTADRLIHDEKDSSKQDVVKAYQARLQHSKYKQKHVFSHPSAEGTGVHIEWLQSDQKEWFIKCRHCEKEWYLEFPDCIDFEEKKYVCKFCKGELSDDDRRKGRWIARYPGRKYSGYHVSFPMCPWVPASEMIEKYNDKDTTDEFFANIVMGLPFAGSDNKLSKAKFQQNLTTENLYTYGDERTIIGIDTGKHLHYVIGSQKGLFNYGEFQPTEENEHDPWKDMYGLMDRWTKMIAVVDAGGDLIGTRKFQAKYPGRVFLCSFREDTKGKQLTRWGEKDENGTVLADRNRLISFVVGEFGDKRIPVMGEFESGGEQDWYDYWLHWNALSKVKELDPKTGEVKRRIWVRNGADHWALATVYYRVGISRFSEGGSVSSLKLKIDAPEEVKEVITPDDIRKTFYAKKSNDWRVK